MRKPTIWSRLRRKTFLQLGVAFSDGCRVHPVSNALILSVCRDWPCFCLSTIMRKPTNWSRLRRKTFLQLGVAFLDGCRVHPVSNALILSVCRDWPCFCLD